MIRARKLPSITFLLPLTQLWQENTATIQGTIPNWSVLFRTYMA